MPNVEYPLAVNEMSLVTTVYGSTATIACHFGYWLNCSGFQEIHCQNETTITCQGTGMWSQPSKMFECSRTRKFSSHLKFISLLFICERRKKFWRFKFMVGQNFIKKIALFCLFFKSIENSNF